MQRQLADELRTARLAGGLSLREVSAKSGVSRSQLARLEGADAPGASLRAYAVLFAVLGMRLSARPYPEGPPIRDAAHVRLLARFRSKLPADVQFRSEIPLRYDRDLRAWDGEVAASNGSCKIEAETALHDLQATDRKIALKMADDRVAHVILLVSDTRRNQRVLREYRELIRERYPLDTREVMGTLQGGQVPRRGGLVVL